MPRYVVGYSEHRIMNITVEAESKDEAEKMVSEGNVDFDDATEQDAEVTSVNSVEEIKDG
jgi:capsular polysaccharide biosynthesis protein